MEFSNVLVHQLPVFDVNKFKHQKWYKKPELPYSSPKKEIFVQQDPNKKKTVWAQSVNPVLIIPEKNKTEYHWPQNKRADHILLIQRNQLDEKPNDVTAWDQAKTEQQHQDQQLQNKQQMEYTGYLKIKDRNRQFQNTQYQVKAERKMKHMVELKRQYRLLKDAVKHIVNADGEKRFNRAAKNLEEKAGITFESIKRESPADAAGILESLSHLRTLVSKKTDEFEMIRQTHGDDFLTQTEFVSQLSETEQSLGDDKTSLASDMMSKYQSEHSKQKDREIDEKLARFQDIDALKKKWGLKTDDQVKAGIKRILVKEILSEAQHVKVRTMREKGDEREQELLENPVLARKVAQEKALEEQKQAKREREQKEKKKEKQQRFSLANIAKYNHERKVSQANPDNHKETKIKDQYFETSGNVFLTKGELFVRTKEYSNLFGQKAQEKYKSLVCQGAE